MIYEDIQPVKLGFEYSQFSLSTTTNVKYI